MRRAYSSIRFPEPRRRRGDSLRRQAKLTEGYCERTKRSLDTSLALRDLGVSAYRGDNAATGALAAFLDAVRTGRVPKGAVLIVENLDRLTRNETLDAFELFASILRAGVTIATLSPEREYTRAAANANGGIIMEAVLSLFLGHEESRKKSERVIEGWRARPARADREKATARVPAWLRLRPNRTAFELIPGAADAVRRIFRMAVDGYGIRAIVRVLNAEGVPAIGRAQVWYVSYVRKVLTSRAAIGEYQSYTIEDPVEGSIPIHPRFASLLSSCSTRRRRPSPARWSGDISRTDRPGLPPGGWGGPGPGLTRRISPGRLHPLPGLNPRLASPLRPSAANSNSSGCCPVGRRGAGGGEGGERGDGRPGWAGRGLRTGGCRPGAAALPG